MAVTEAQLHQAVDVCAATAQTCAAAQQAAERAVEEIRAHVKALKEWERSQRTVVQEVVREVVSGPVIDLTPLEQRIANLENRPNLPAIIEAPGWDPDRMAQLEAAVNDIRSRPQRLVPVSNVDESRVANLEAQVAEVVRQLRESKAHVSGSDVVGDLASSLLDRMSALETLVVESVQAPHALANQLRITSEIMEAMDQRITAMRDADKALLEMHRQASEQTALAQGGLSVVVESLKTEMATIAQTVASLQNRIARRDDYTAQIVRRGRG